MQDEEEGYSDAYLIKEIFGMSPEGFEYYRNEVNEGLRMSEDVFWNLLGNLLVYANTNQAVKLINTFRLECENHAWLHRIQEASDKEKQAIRASMSK